MSTVMFNSKQKCLFHDSTKSPSYLHLKLNETYAYELFFLSKKTNPRAAIVLFREPETISVTHYAAFSSILAVIWVVILLREVAILLREQPD